MGWKRYSGHFQVWGLRNRTEGLRVVAGKPFCRSKLGIARRELLVSGSAFSSDTVWSPLPWQQLYIPRRPFASICTSTWKSLSHIPNKRRIPSALVLFSPSRPCLVPPLNLTTWNRVGAGLVCSFWTGAADI